MSSDPEELDSATLLRYELARHRANEREEWMTSVRSGEALSMLTKLQDKGNAPWSLKIDGGGEKLHGGMMQLMRRHYHLGVDDGLVEGAQRLKEWLMSKHPEMEQLEVATIVTEPDRPSPGEILQMIRSAEHQLRVALYEGDLLKMQIHNRRIGKLLDELKAQRKTKRGPAT